MKIVYTSFFMFGVEKRIVVMTVAGRDGDLKHCIYLSYTNGSFKYKFACIYVITYNTIWRDESQGDAKKRRTYI